MPEESQKGVAGENTGGKARSEIKKAKSRGATNESIAKAVNRDPDTIRNIASGNIENPPPDVVENISKAKSVEDRFSNSASAPSSINRMSAAEYGDNLIKKHGK